MKTFMFKGNKTEVTEIIKEVRYTEAKNMYYMNRILPEYFGKRWTSNADSLWRSVNNCLHDFCDEERQSLLDMSEEMMTKLKEEVEWTDLDQKAIEYLEVKSFTELREEQRDKLNFLYTAVTR